MENVEKKNLYHFSLDATVKQTSATCADADIFDSGDEKIISYIMMSLPVVSLDVLD